MLCNVMLCYYVCMCVYIYVQDMVNSPCIFCDGLQPGDFVLFAQLLDGQNILVASSKRVVPQLKMSMGWLWVSYPHII
jgi:hypothetical protein